MNGALNTWKQTRSIKVIKSANKVTGHLLRTFNPEGGDYVFRVYGLGGTFTDYDIHHVDLCITIEDEDAFFYSGDGIDRIDHSPQTLGLKEE
jgi:hypothetical protein